MSYESVMSTKITLTTYNMSISLRSLVKRSLFLSLSTLEHHDVVAIFCCLVVSCHALTAAADAASCQGNAVAMTAVCAGSLEGDKTPARLDTGPHNYNDTKHCRQRAYNCAKSWEKSDHSEPSQFCALLRITVFCRAYVRSTYRLTDKSIFSCHCVLNTVRVSLLFLPRSKT